ncbi:MAG: fibronectin type III domain-containing protein [Armatimonadota bacterium]|jgi:hypothetical protein
MAIRIHILICLCLTLTVAPAFSSTPITNPGFEQGMDGWTAYSYQPYPEVQPAEPQTGCVGASPCVFNLLNDTSVPEGGAACGIQSFETTGNGGVCQTFSWTGDAASISVTARAYSEKYDTTPYNNGCRVRMGLVSGVAQSRDEVYNWTEFPWGDQWCTRTLQVPGAGTYTIFIEAEQPNSSAIMSTLWDKVDFTPQPPVLITLGPTITRDPLNPDTSLTISWSTNVPSSSIVDYGLTDAYSQTEASQTLVTEHNVTLSGLEPSKQYYYKITSEAAGYLSYVSDHLTFKNPIWLSDIVTKVGPSGDMTIEWRTDLLSTSQVEYWTGSGPHVFTEEAYSYVTKHKVNLGVLDEGTQYSFRVWSRRPGYTDASSEIMTFWTLPEIGWSLANGDFECITPGQGHSLSPWVQYTTQEGVSGYNPIDGLIGPYPSGGSNTWLAGVTAYNGSYFLGAGASLAYKNGGVFQRVYVDPGDFYTLSARYMTYQVGGEEGYTEVKIGIDPEGGIDPGSPNIVWWHGHSATNDATWHPAAITVTAGENGVATVFLEFEHLFALKWHVSAIDGVRFESPKPRSVGALKASKDSLGGILEDKIVTHISPNQIYALGRVCQKVYVQDDNRSAGIGVLLPLGDGPNPQLMRGLTATGSLIIINKEAVFYASQWSLGTSRQSLPKPFAMSQASVGKAGPNQPALNQKSAGLSNVGLRVRLFGRVSWIDPWNGSVYIDDGTHLMDGTVAGEAPVRGIRTQIINKPAQTPAVGDYIAVTGVLGVELVDPDNWPDPTDYPAYKIFTNSSDDWDLLWTAP